MTLQLGPGWRDDRMYFHFRHGDTDHTVLDSVGERLTRDSYCMGCIGNLPEDATDEQWEACRIPASEWRQVKPGQKVTP
jgi:hypothetical protein